MPGAGILAARAAARVGAGYVFLAGADLNNKSPPDFLPVDRSKKIDFSKFQAVAIGPGLGISAKSRQGLKRWLRALKKSGCKNVVVDADALNFLALDPSILPLPHSWVVTPHAGELSRILKLHRSMKTEERKQYLARGQTKLGCHLLLKGNPTFLTDGNRTKIIKAGNKALAKAGTGDVLTGMIAGLMSQGLSAWNAAYVASYIHGTIADEWVKKNDYLSLMASDLIEKLPAAIFKLRR